MEAEQRSEGGLRAGVQVNLRLLQQEQRGRVGIEQFGDGRQRLADAVADVDQVSSIPAGFLTTLPDVYLERPADGVAKGINFDFVKQP